MWPGKNKKLVVDDEPDMILTLCSVLEESGFEVAFFSNPFLALQSFKPHYYDLVILDIRMPEINGFELYRQLKKKDKHMKVCFLTASEMFYERYRKNKYNSLEKYLFLRKPISNEHLVEEITAFMAM